MGFVARANLIVLNKIKTPCEIMFVLSTLDSSKVAQRPIPRVRLYSPLDSQFRERDWKFARLSTPRSSKPDMCYRQICCCQYEPLSHCSGRQLNLGPMAVTRRTHWVSPCPILPEAASIDTAIIQIRQGIAGQCV